MNIEDYNLIYPYIERFKKYIIVLVYTVHTTLVLILNVDNSIILNLIFFTFSIFNADRLQQNVYQMSKIYARVYVCL